MLPLKGLLRSLDNILEKYYHYLVYQIHSIIRNYERAKRGFYNGSSKSKTRL